MKDFLCYVIANSYLCRGIKQMTRIMEAKTTAKQNPILRLLEYKRAMRECIQRGADHEEMKQITKDYGFTLATPV